MNTRTYLTLGLILFALAALGLLDPSAMMAVGFVGHTGAAALLGGDGDKGAGGGGGGGGGGGPANDFAWLPAELSPELKTFAQNKGWKDPGSALLSYQHLEKTLGADRIVIPKDEKDAAGWDAFYAAGGRPKAAGEYKLPVPDGQDGKFAELAGAQFHALGLNTRQAQGIAKWWNEYAATMAKDAGEARAAQSKREEDELRGEKGWGAAFDQNNAIAKRAANAFGINVEMMNKLDEALGTKATMVLLHSIGSKIGEHNAAGITQENKGQPGFGNAMTPEQAQAEIAALKNDSEFNGRLLKGDKDTVARWARLFEWAYPKAPGA